MFNDRQLMDMHIKNVLLVDDNETDNFISKRIIEITNFAEHVVVKKSGKSALEYIHEHRHNLDVLPDLIFLDINMPIVDGYVFLYEFDAFDNAIKNKCKVVILSSSDNKRDIDKLINNENVIKFVTKPLTEQVLAELDL